VAWLCRTQESDGSWNTARWGGSKQFEVALTGLSLMAILGEVETPAGARRAGIDRAVEYLLGLQDEHGEFGTAFDAAPYNQGIATLALLHAYRAQKSDRVKAAIDRALAAICRRQHPDGGWGYRQEATPASNLPITLWQIEALRLAAASGWSDLRAPIGRSSRWIASVADEDGTFGYRQKRDFPEGSPTLTAMGAMSVLAGAKGVPIPPARRQAIKAQVEQLAAAPVETLDYYRRYFLAAALVRLDEESARERLSTMRRELAGRQVRQGPDRGSWRADDRWSSAGGRVYATAMASLSMR
jgi:prenyltransferase beta subunit